jgi:amphiphysin
MLSHQIEFSRSIKEIYQPISGRMSDPDSIISEGNQAGIEACEQYEAIVAELQQTLEPELEMIETRVIKPAEELLVIIKQIRKAIVKRDHKQLDYDRHRAALKKLQDKKDKSLKDEKAMYKAEGDVEVATQEFNYFNDLLKQELPKLFQYEREFIKPLFQSFYYMQLNVFYTLHERMQGLDIGYFNLTLGIEEAFEAKRGSVQEAAEALSITRFKREGGKKAPKYGPGAVAGRLAIGDRADRTPRLAIENKPAYGAAADTSSYSPHSPAGSDAAPPPYSSPHLAAHSYDTKTSPAPAAAANNWGVLAKKKGAAPPPPKPKPSRLSGVPQVETCTALYDYEAQAEGDLSFSTGEVIEIVQRTQNDNEWWTGRIRGREGQFPGELSSRLYFCFGVHLLWSCLASGRRKWKRSCAAPTRLRVVTRSLKACKAMRPNVGRRRGSLSGVQGSADNITFKAWATQGYEVRPTESSVLDASPVSGS